MSYICIHIEKNTLKGFEFNLQIPSAASLVLPFHFFYCLLVRVIQSYILVSAAFY